MNPFREIRLLVVRNLDTTEELYGVEAAAKWYEVVTIGRQVGRSVGQSERVDLDFGEIGGSYREVVALANGWDDVLGIRKSETWLAGVLFHAFYLICVWLNPAWNVELLLILLRTPVPTGLDQSVVITVGRSPNEF